MLFFSTTVDDLSLSDLAAGRVQTTYGTDFNCVIDHALEAGATRILIITDGYDWVSSPQRQAAEAANLGVFVLYTESPYGDGLKLIERQSWVLPCGA